MVKYTEFGWDLISDAAHDFFPFPCWLINISIIYSRPSPPESGNGVGVGGGGGGDRGIADDPLHL